MATMWLLTCEDNHSVSHLECRKKKIQPIVELMQKYLMTL